MTRSTAPFRPRAEPLDARDCPAVFGSPWPDPGLTLSFVPDGTDVNGVPSRLTAAFPGTSADAWQREILRAFQTWVVTANLDVGLVTDGGQPVGTAGPRQGDARFGDVRVAAVALGPDAVAVAMPYDVTAGTRSGDVWFNADVPFATSGGTGFDPYSVSLHEAGHVFGIPGGTDPDSAMFQGAVRTRTGLSAADVRALTDLYGPRAPDAHEGETGNETPATATEARFGGGPGSPGAARRAADLTTVADVDVYEFRAEQLRGGGVTAAVHVSGLSLLVPRLEILDAAGTVVAAAVGYRPGAGDASVHITTPSDGATYYARVSAGTDTAFSVGRYELELRPDAAGRDDRDDELDDPEVGSDDTLETANDLRQQFTRTGPRYDYAIASSLSTPTDVDYYRLRSPHAEGASAGVMTATVWATGPTGTDPVLDVFDRRGHRVPATVLVHDGGEFTVQVAKAAANEDYYVAIRHARSGPGGPGNYSLGVDFGQAAVPLQGYAAGVLTAAAPIHSHGLSVAPAGVLHLVLSTGPASSAAGVRLSILDRIGQVVGTRFAAAGESASLTVFLGSGAYQVLVAGGTTDETALSDVRYAVHGGIVSDPIGPRAVDPAPQPIGPLPPPAPQPPPPVPPPVVTWVPPRPLTPVVPVAPTDPNWVVTPPTDWPAPPETILRPVRPLPSLPRTFSISADTGPTVRALNPDTTERFVLTAEPGFSGGVRVAEGDFNGDGITDVVIGTAPGSPSRVRIIDGATRVALFTLDPFEPAFTGGVYVAAGDVTGDGKADLIISPDEGGGPRVRVFDGGTFGPVIDFFGIEDPAFRGGARAAVGDIDGDGGGDLVVAAGFGGGPRVAGYRGESLPTGQPVKVFNDFFAFEQTLRNGVFVTAGDLDGDGLAEVIAGGGPGGGPRVTAFGGAALLANDHEVVANFFGGDPESRGGVRVAAKNLDGDARADLVIGAGTGAGSRVTAYLGAHIQRAGTPPPAFDLDAFPGFTGGVFVG